MAKTKSAVYTSSSDIFFAIVDADILIDKTFIGPYLIDLLTN